MHIVTALSFMASTHRAGMNAMSGGRTGISRASPGAYLFTALKIRELFLRNCSQAAGGRGKASVDADSASR
jgi:hypothetical protein